MVILVYDLKSKNINIIFKTQKNIFVVELLY